MAYMQRPRFHFAGQFQATVPTINNVPSNFAGPVGPVLWNPEGTGAWRLGGRITGLHHDDGVDGTADALARGFVLDAGADVSAKLVDLDPEQQMVSEIWGLTVRVLGPDADPLLRGLQADWFLRPARPLPFGIGDGVAGRVISVGARGPRLGGI